MRRNEEYVGKVMMMDVVGRRSKGRPKRRLVDSVNVDLNQKGLSEEKTQKRVAWRQLV